MKPTSKQPCPRCTREGFTIWHTPEVCERDWLHHETTFRIDHSMDDWWPAVLAGAIAGQVPE